jgi:uncharacterized protein (TIGR03435 family)
MKLLLGIFCALSMTQAQSSLPSFEVASIKPNKTGDMRMMLRIAPGSKFEASGVTIKLLLEQAYNIKDDQLSGAPPWLDSERYDINAKPEDSVAAEMEKLPMEQRREKFGQMIQSLLIERCKLEVGHDSKELPIYALVVAKNGPKMTKSNFVPPDKPPAGPPPTGKDGVHPQGSIMMQGRGNLTATGVELSALVNILSRAAGRMVVDKTGLSGRWDYKLQWTPDNNEGPAPPGGPPAGAPPPETSGPDLFTAIQEQLGLKLEAQKAPVDIIVIKHIEKPSEN